MHYVSGKAQGKVGYDTIRLGDFRMEGQAFGRSNNSRAIVVLHVLFEHSLQTSQVSP